MKIVGIVGSISDVSSNRNLLNFIEKRYPYIFDFEIVEIKNVPLFDQDNDQTREPELMSVIKKIRMADGIIISTPEHNSTLPAPLKNILDWLTFRVHVLINKPVMITGAIYKSRSSTQALDHVRQILNAPGVEALVMPGPDFLLSNSSKAFDKNNFIIDKDDIEILEKNLFKFQKFIKVAKQLSDPDEWFDDNVISLQTTAEANTSRDGLLVIDDTTGPSSHEK